VTKKTPPTKAKDPTPDEAERLLLEAKEARGRDVGDPFTHRDPRPAPPDPPSKAELERQAKIEEEKRLNKEARNRHPTAITVPKSRPEPEPVEPPRPMTTEEIQAKERRGLR
jgi:hypothetical protein